jgi:hypothetical protein
MTLSELRELIDIDVNETEITLSNISELLEICKSRDPTVHELAAFGTYIQNVYTGFENILSRLAKYKNVPIPERPDWHASLLRMFSDPPSPGLPIIIRGELADRIGEYRGFRHLFNNRYASHLDWDKLRPLAINAQSTFEALHEAAPVIVNEWAK